MLKLNYSKQGKSICLLEYLFKDCRLSYMNIFYTMKRIAYTVKLLDNIYFLISLVVAFNLKSCCILSFGGEL